jgi:hypothetical protein
MQVSRQVLSSIFWHQSLTQDGGLKEAAVSKSFPGQRISNTPSSSGGGGGGSNSSSTSSSKINAK